MKYIGLELSELSMASDTTYIPGDDIKLAVNSELGFWI